MPIGNWQSKIGNVRLNTRPRLRLRRNSLLRRHPVRRDRVQLLPSQFHILHKTLFRPYPCPSPHGHQHRIQGKFRSALFHPPHRHMNKGRAQPRSGGARHLVSNPVNLPASDGICNHLFPFRRSPFSMDHTHVFPCFHQPSPTRRSVVAHTAAYRTNAAPEQGLT
jgi:hypothetical protein